MFKKSSKILHISIGIILLLIWTFDLFHNPNVLNFLSYFTVESIFLYAMLAIIYGLNKKTNPLIDSLRGAVTVYIIVVAAGFVLLVEKTQGPLILPWINTLYHKIMPFIILADWIFFPPKVLLRYKQAIYWLIIPLLFSGYTLVRGFFINWYPYDFVDPVKHGYQSVLINLFVFLMFLVITSFIIIFIGNKMWRKNLFSEKTSK
nr:Pr6Pr family membrane protein [Candidatus Levybacteria bacterium]